LTYRCSENELGSTRGTVLTEHSSGERRPSCRRSRSLGSCDLDVAPCETLGETVMLVCPSLSVALTCRLARSLGSAPRCSSSRLCSESDIQMAGAPSTQLRKVPSAGLHMLSPGSERLPQVYGRGSDCRRSEAGARHAPPGSLLYARRRRELRQYLPWPHVWRYCDVPRARALDYVWLLARERHHYLFPWGARQYWKVLFSCPARQHWARPDSPWWIVSSARRWISGSKGSGRS